MVWRNCGPSPATIIGRHRPERIGSEYGVVYGISCSWTSSAVPIVTAMAVAMALQKTRSVGQTKAGQVLAGVTSAILPRPATIGAIGTPNPYVLPMRWRGRPASLSRTWVAHVPARDIDIAVGQGDPIMPSDPEDFTAEELRLLASRPGLTPEDRRLIVSALRDPSPRVRALARLLLLLCPEQRAELMAYLEDPDAARVIARAPFN
jgi:hypothetical protein